MSVEDDVVQMECKVNMTACIGNLFFSPPYSSYRIPFSSFGSRDLEDIESYEQDGLFPVSSWPPQTISPASFFNAVKSKIDYTLEPQTFVSDPAVKVGEGEFPTQFLCSSFRCSSVRAFRPGTILSRSSRTGSWSAPTDRKETDDFLGGFARLRGIWSPLNVDRWAGVLLAMLFHTCQDDLWIRIRYARLGYREAWVLDSVF